jgi:hypothetical protein
VTTPIAPCIRAVRRSKIAAGRSGRQSTAGAVTITVPGGAFAWGAFVLEIVALGLVDTTALVAGLAQRALRISLTTGTLVELLVAIQARAGNRARLTSAVPVAGLETVTKLQVGTLVLYIEASRLINAASASRALLAQGTVAVLRQLIDADTL